MPCSLEYDDVLSRVRIDATTACATGVVDTFTRTVTGAGGWGSTDNGLPWTVVGTQSQYLVTGGNGIQYNPAIGVTHTSFLNVGSINSDFTAHFGTDKVATGNVYVVELASRYTSDSDYYATRALLFPTTNAITVDIRKRIAGVETALMTAVTISGITHSANTKFAYRFQVNDDVLRSKLWVASGTEPATWNAEVTDSSITSGTNIAVRSVLAPSVSNAPVRFAWDNVRTAEVTTATVDRTTDGVTYTTVRGASDVGITTGCELERTIDDYEFPVGQVITYRVRSYTDDGVFVGFTTCQIEVDLDEVWLKSIGRPFLNRSVDCVLNPSPIQRRARNGIFPVVGRSYPIAITDVRSSREVPLQVVTQTTQERQDMDLLIASGDPIYVQTPLDYPLPTMYAVIGDTSESRPVANRNCDNDWRLWELPLTEVAAPGPDVVGSTSTWQTVVNTYATWADVMANHDTWASLLELVGDGSEVIVP